MRTMPGANGKASRTTVAYPSLLVPFVSCFLSDVVFRRQYEGRGGQHECSVSAGILHCTVLTCDCSTTACFSCSTTTFTIAELPTFEASVLLVE